MTNQHPITPPPELVQELWEKLRECSDDSLDAAIAWTHAITAAAQWGADQELEACCEWLDYNGPSVYAHYLRSDRRPKPPSLKEQALKAAHIELDPDGRNGALIIRALEALPND